MPLRFRPLLIRTFATAILLPVILFQVSVDSSAKPLALPVVQNNSSISSATGNPKGPYPGIYIFYDKYNVDPAEYPHLTGGNFPFSWDDIEIRMIF